MDQVSRDASAIDSLKSPAGFISHFVQLTDYKVVPMIFLYFLGWLHWAAPQLTGLPQAANVES